MNSAVAVLALLAAAAPSSPEDALRAAAKTSGASKVGEWVIYRMEAGPGRVAFWRMAAVEEAKGAQGEDLLWLEVELGTHPNFAAPMAQLRMLVPRILDLERQDIYRLVVGIAGENSAELDGDALRLAVAPAEESKRAAPIQAIAVDKVETVAIVQTQAGPVKASPYRLLFQGRVAQVYWVSKEVPLLRLAKIEIPSLGQSLVVHDFGTDAKPRVAMPPANGAKIRLEGAHASPDPSVEDGWAH